MTSETTPLELDTGVSMDRQSRVRMNLTALGALVGGLIAFVATGILVEALIVLLGALVGWVVGLGAALLLDRRRREHQEDERSRDALYAEAKRLGIEGRSEMNKAELSAAVEQARG